MTVGDLIEKLERLPKDHLVVVDGYEAGYAEDIKVKEIEIIQNFHGDEDGIYGRHGEWHWLKGNEDKVTTSIAVLIGEDRHDRRYTV